MQSPKHEVADREERQDQPHLVLPIDSTEIKCRCEVDPFSWTFYRWGNSPGGGPRWDGGSCPTRRSSGRRPYGSSGRAGNRSEQSPRIWGSPISHSVTG